MSTRLIKFTNNARSTLDGEIAAGATAAAVQSGHGTRFPSISGSEYFYATLDDGSGVIEIIKVTARTGDSFGTIARAQEGTTAVAWGDGSLIQLRLTEDGMQGFVGEGQEHTSRTDLPTNSVADQGITYAVGNDRRVTLAGSGDTSQDLFHMDENGLVLRPGMGYATLSDDAHDWSTLVAPEIPMTIYMTPTAARIITLPVTKVPLGFPLRIVNLASTAGFNITINSSGGDLIWVVCPGNHCELLPVVKAPTTAANWRVIDSGWPVHATVQKSSDDQNNQTENTILKVTFDEALIDPSSMFNDANDRFILPVAGWWVLTGSVLYTTATNDFAASSGFHFNGAEAEGAHYTGLVITAGATGLPFTLFVEATIEVTDPGVDYVELITVYNEQVVTNQRDIIAASSDTNWDGNKGTYMSARWLGHSV